MTLKDVDAAVEEAKRFIHKASVLKAAVNAYNREYREMNNPVTSSHDIACCPRETGAVKRSSLDLWRSLAAMRQRRHSQ